MTEDAVIINHEQNTTWVDSVRFALIRWLAGETTVVLNLVFAPGVSVHAGNENIFMANCSTGIAPSPGCNSAQKTEDLRASGRGWALLP